MALSTPRLLRFHLRHPNLSHTAVETCGSKFCGALSGLQTVKHLHPVRIVHRTSCSVQLLAESLVRKGTTPVGEGLISCRNCRHGTQLLQVALTEVVAAAQPDVGKNKSRAKPWDATAAYPAMPKRLLQFVQGMLKSRLYILLLVLCFT